jgi:AAA15 family ATPase/GTPase
MIRELHINNYKSLHDITVDVARFNVLIGENGCGKSNILEAIALIAATVSNKLDNEFLVSRGIRVTSPELMRSAFNTEDTQDTQDTQEPIKIKSYYENSNIPLTYTLKNNNKAYAKWERISDERHIDELSKNINNFNTKQANDPKSIDRLATEWHDLEKRILSRLLTTSLSSYIEAYPLIATQEDLIPH